MTAPYYSSDSMTAQNSVGYLLKRCGVLGTVLAERRFQSQPISFTQWIVLMQLTVHAHQSPSELSTHLGHDMGALTRVVDDLLQKKLVLRQRSERDRRGVQITLTAEGRRLALDTKVILADLFNELLEPYSKREVDQLISLLQRMLVRMEQVDEATKQSSGKD